MATPSRNYRFSANVQVVIDAGTRLVVATGQPAPSNDGDAQALRHSGIDEVCAGQTVLAHRACWGALA